MDQYMFGLQYAFLTWLNPLLLWTYLQVLQDGKLHRSQIQHALVTCTVFAERLCPRYTGNDHLNLLLSCFHLRTRHTATDSKTIQNQVYIWEDVLSHSYFLSCIKLFNSSLKILKIHSCTLKDFDGGKVFFLFLFV